MSYYDLYSYLPFLLTTKSTTNNNKTTKTNINYPTTPYQNANYLSSSSLSKHDKQYRRTTTAAARYATKYKCTSSNTNYYYQTTIQPTPSIHTQITIKTSNTTANYLNNSTNNAQNYFNNTTNYNPATTTATNYYNNKNNRPLEEQLEIRPEIDESSLSSKSSCTTHSSFQVRSLFFYTDCYICRGVF